MTTYICIEKEDLKNLVKFFEEEIVKGKVLIVAKDPAGQWISPLDPKKKRNYWQVGFAISDIFVDHNLKILLNSWGATIFLVDRDKIKPKILEELSGKKKEEEKAKGG